jgi:hypothetical protein
MSGRTKAAAQSEAARKVEEWNRQCPIGTEVNVRRDNGDVLKTTTRGEAGLMNDELTAVVMVHGITGVYALERVTPVRPAVARATGIDLAELAKRADVTVAHHGLRENVIRCTVGSLSKGNPLVAITAGDLDDEIAKHVLKAATAAALHILAEYKS